MDGNRTQEPRTLVVSVVIPAYNREEYIREAIESAIGQETAFPFEVIVSDDCSTDGTVQVARSFGDGVRVLTSSENRGLAANRNAAIAAARGEFIALLDDDDRMLPGRLQKQAEFLAAHPQVGLAVGLCEEEGEERPLGSYFSRRGIDVPEGEWRIVEHWRLIHLRDYLGIPSASMFRRAFLEDLGLYNEQLQLWEDIELLARAASVGPIACYNGVVSWKRTANSDRMMTARIGALRTPTLYSTLLSTIPDLTPEEVSILTPRYRAAVLGALSAALWHFDRDGARAILRIHGHVLDTGSRRKWSLLSALPWPLVRRLAAMVKNHPAGARARDGAA